MPKKKPADATQKPGRKQYNVGVDLDTAKRIDRTAQTLGLDGVNFLRMLIHENLPRYEERAEQVRNNESPD